MTAHAFEPQNQDHSSNDKSQAKDSPTRRLYRLPTLSTIPKIRLSTAVILIAIFSFASFAVGYNRSELQDFARFVSGKKSYKLDFSELNNLYTDLKYSFDGEVNAAKALEGAKHGLADSLGDEFTYYMNAEEARRLRDDLSGEVGSGIGVEIGLRDNLIKVLRVLPDNPAKRAGVLAGDIIFKADDEDISGLSVEKVAQKLRGEKGSKVKLTVLRGKEEKTFDLIRTTINNPSVLVDYRDHTAIMTVSRFDEDTARLATGFAKDFQKRGDITKVVLDLRGNGGGYTSAAVDLASLWLNGKLVAKQKSISGAYDETMQAKTDQNLLANYKTVVLVNGATASAAEIVTGALKDHHAATIIGEKTYGKGSVQELRELDMGSLLRVTVAKWYTPNGINLNHDGIQPDRKVERSFDDINAERDPQLDAALAF